MKKMEEFTAVAGILTADDQKAHETYGEPKPYNQAMQIDRTDADVSFKAHDGLHDRQCAREGASGSATTPGPRSPNLTNKMDPRVDSDRDVRPGLEIVGGDAGTATGGGSNTTDTGSY
jgi:hypothetical protein